MNKKQLGAFLKVMSKDDSRPILMTAKVDRYNDEPYLVATDGYVLAAVKLDEDAIALDGKLIRRSALERWYKLATGKDRLDTRELVRVSSDDYAVNGEYEQLSYPDWTKVVPSGVADGADEIAFNAEYAKVLQDLDGSDGLAWTIYGKLQPLMANTERGTYLLMPRKV